VIHDLVEEFVTLNPPQEVSTNESSRWRLISPSGSHLLALQRDHSQEAFRGVQGQRNMKEKTDEQSTFFMSQGDAGLLAPDAERPSLWFLKEYPLRMRAWVEMQQTGGPKGEELKRIGQVGQQLRALRSEQDLSREEFAEHTNTNSDLLFFMERGLVSSAEALEVLDQMAEGIGLDLSDLRHTLCNGECRSELSKEV
jgi:hypothetical protein